MWFCWIRQLKMSWFIGGGACNFQLSFCAILSCFFIHHIFKYSSIHLYFLTSSITATSERILIGQAITGEVLGEKRKQRLKESEWGASVLSSQTSPFCATPKWPPDTQNNIIYNLGTSGPPLPHISMMSKWRVFAPSRLHHCFRGEGR